MRQVRLYFGGAEVADRNLEFFFRFAGILMVISIVCLIITQTGSPEFVVSLVSLVLSTIVLVVCSIILNKKK